MHEIDKPIDAAAAAAAVMQPIQTRTGCAVENGWMLHVALTKGGQFLRSKSTSSVYKASLLFSQMSNTHYGSAAGF